MNVSLAHKTLRRIMKHGLSTLELWSDIAAPMLQRRPRSGVARQPRSVVVRGPLPEVRRWAEHMVDSFSRSVADREKRRRFEHHYG